MRANEWNVQRAVVRPSGARQVGGGQVASASLFRTTDGAPSEVGKTTRCRRRLRPIFIFVMSNRSVIRLRCQWCPSSNEDTVDGDPYRVWSVHPTNGRRTRAWIAYGNRHRRTAAIQSSLRRRCTKTCSRSIDGCIADALIA